MSKEDNTPDICPECGRNRKVTGYSHRCVPIAGWVKPRPADAEPLVLDPPEATKEDFARSTRQRLSEAKPAAVRKPASADKAPRKAKVQAAADAVVSGIAPSHPDCKRCEQIREQTRNRVRKVRAKK